MGRVKEYFFKHIHEFPDKLLLSYGYSQKEIDFMKDRDIQTKQDAKSR